MAARVAAELATVPDVNVHALKGGFGEFSISIDGEKLIEPRGLWFLRPSKVVAKAKALLAESS